MKYKSIVGDGNPSDPTNIIYRGSLMQTSFEDDFPWMGRDFDRDSFILRVHHLYEKERSNDRSLGILKDNFYIGIFKIPGDGELTIYNERKYSIYMWSYTAGPRDEETMRVKDRQYLNKLALKNPKDFLREMTTGLNLELDYHRELRREFSPLVLRIQAERGLNATRSVTSNAAAGFVSAGAADIEDVPRESGDLEIMPFPTESAVVAAKSGLSVPFLNSRKRDSGFEEKEPPNHFLCPISLDLMIDPVVDSVGNTYDRSSIQQVLDSGDMRDPLTREDITNILTPNRSLKSQIEEWKTQSKFVKKSESAVCGIQ